MKTFVCLVCAIFLITNFGFAQEGCTLKECLMECYNLDANAAKTVLSKFIPLIQHPDVAEEFIQLSQSLQIDFSANPPSQNLVQDDAVTVAPEFHEVLFESPFVRILWGVTKPGESEPFHTHQWRHIMVILSEAKFQMEYADGTVEIDTFPIGVYDLPAESASSAYTNIGDSVYKSVIFEIK